MIAGTSRQPALNLRMAAFALLGIAFALAVARIAKQGGVALPVCGWRWLTGLPCPLCGGVRCLDALSHGEILRALALNPMVFLGLVGGLTLTLHSRLRRWLQMHAPARRGCWLAMVAMAALINWIYLIAVLR